MMLPQLHASMGRCDLPLDEQLCASWLWMPETSLARPSSRSSTPSILEEICADIISPCCWHNLSTIIEEMPPWLSDTGRSDAKPVDEWLDTVRNVPASAVLSECTLLRRTIPGTRADYGFGSESPAHACDVAKHALLCGA